MAITFKSEEERAEAISKISSDPADAPIGKKIDDFMRENEEMLDELISAEIVPDGEGNQDPDGSNNPINDGTPELDPNPIPKPESNSEPDGNKGTDDDSETARLQRRNQALQDQRDELMDQHAREMASLQEQINDLKKGVQASPKEDKEEEDLPIDTEISTVQSQIDELEQFMNDPDVDMFDEEYAKKMRKLNLLSIKLTGLVNKRSNQIISEQRQEIDDIKKKQKLTRDAEKKKTNRKTMFKSIETFREKVPELQGRKYEDMDAEYTDFAREIASLWFDTPINKITSRQAEVAVHKYLTNVPELMDRVNQKGIVAPNGLQQYVILSDIHALRMGYVLDRKTGEWKQMKDSRGKDVTFPSLKAAWNHYKEENPLPKAEKVIKENKSAQGVVDAITKRADVVELDESHKESDIGEMSKSAAENYIAKYSEEYIAMKARKNYDDPEVQDYNKALKVLDMAPLEREDFE